MSGNDDSSGSDGSSEESEPLLDGQIITNSKPKPSDSEGDGDGE